MAAPTSTRVPYPVPTTSSSMQQAPVTTDTVKKLPVVQVGKNSLCLVETSALSESANALNAQAGSQPAMPMHKPDGAGAMLIFHTPEGIFVLGGMRNNPALDNAFTDNGGKFPQQINSTIGGYMTQPELPLRQSVMTSIRNKFFAQGGGDQKMEQTADRQIIEDLCRTIEHDDGWESQVCVHTSKWANEDGSEGQMCFMTAVKHIACSHGDLEKIEKALASNIESRKSASAVLSAFKFIPLEPLVENSKATYDKDEVSKAQNAYTQFQDSVAVTFNDMAVATFAQGNALQHSRPAHLALPVANFSGPSSNIQAPLLQFTDKALIEQKQFHFMKEFGYLRLKTLSIVNTVGPAINLMGAVHDFIASCHELMLDSINQTGNLDAANVILHSGEALLEQIHQMCFPLAGTSGERLKPFPLNLVTARLQCQARKNE